MVTHNSKSDLPLAGNRSGSNPKVVIEHISRSPHGTLQTYRHNMDSMQDKSHNTSTSMKIKDFFPFLFGKCIRML